MSRSPRTLTCRWGHLLILVASRHERENDWRPQNQEGDGQVGRPWSTVAVGPPPAHHLTGKTTSGFRYSPGYAWRIPLGPSRPGLAWKQNRSTGREFSCSGEAGESFLLVGSQNPSMTGMICRRVTFDKTGIVTRHPTNQLSWRILPTIRVLSHGGSSSHSL